MDVQREDFDCLASNSFLSGMPSVVTAAHELKSPLALIRQLSLALEESEFDIDEKRRIIKQITLTSERAIRLTGDLTRSARLSDAMFELEPINPQQICEDVIHELRPLFLANNKDIRLINRKHPLLLVANRDLLRRIITNFSDNALHYSGEGKVVEIKIGSIASGSTIRLAVRDYGPSFSMRAAKSIKSNAPTDVNLTNSRPQSSGLGLFIASQFAEVMNGEIGVTRHRKDGVTFYVDLQASRQLSLL